jgi:hypothetical protein
MMVLNANPNSHAVVSMTQKLNTVHDNLREMPQNIITDVLQRADLATLQQLQTSLANSGNKIDLRYKALVKAAFAEHIAAIEDTKAVLKIAETAALDTIMLMTASQFATDNGQVSWETLNKTLQDVLLRKAAQYGAAAANAAA